VGGEVLGVVTVIASVSEAIQSITGLVPVIHVLLSFSGDKDVDGRVI
jgi:hypothetical protein